MTDCLNKTRKSNERLQSIVSKIHMLIQMSQVVSR